MGNISFCKGCKYWAVQELYHHGYYGGYYRYCKKFGRSLAKRREICNGDYKEAKNKTTKKKWKL